MCMVSGGPTARLCGPRVGTHPARGRFVVTDCSMMAPTANSRFLRRKVVGHVLSETRRCRRRPIASGRPECVPTGGSGPRGAPGWGVSIRSQRGASPRQAYLTGQTGARSDDGEAKPQTGTMRLVHASLLRAAWLPVITLCAALAGCEEGVLPSRQPLAPPLTYLASIHFRIHPIFADLVQPPANR